MKFTPLTLAAAAAIALAPLLLIPTSPATATPSCAGPGPHNAECSDPTGSYDPNQFAPANADNCNSHWYNSCPPCKDPHFLPGFPPQQPVLPCDHSNYQ
ncbi:hypothetical protein [Mycobacterium branderi]|uniref:Secreted protein n=1 Tax=Mycobacterium branderi TaxID=43348 RepID=A0A7I7W4Q4_9MYCO|nr:hypothetical protein [Mycobacterium branderi]MCV7231916.1 hypothetical protein [Mycobacterium branderi]ORA34763.1 hypothetical protein BST20_19485 [Mycobacterium branderi]BBZ12549.1 hypothetical protein MBRA_27440 [Mycobacterium branderi]